MIRISHRQCKVSFRDFKRNDFLGVESLQSGSSYCSHSCLLVLHYKGGNPLSLYMPVQPIVWFQNVYNKTQDLISFLERGVTTGVSVAATDTDDLPYISICPKPPLKYVSFEIFVSKVRNAPKPLIQHEDLERMALGPVGRLCAK